MEKFNFEKQPIADENNNLEKSVDSSMISKNENEKFKEKVIAVLNDYLSKNHFISYEQLAQYLKIDTTLKYENPETGKLTDKGGVDNFELGKVIDQLVANKMLGKAVNKDWVVFYYLKSKEKNLNEIGELKGSFEESKLYSSNFDEKTKVELPKKLV